MLRVFRVFRYLLAVEEVAVIHNDGRINILDDLVQDAQSRWIMVGKMHITVVDDGVLLFRRRPRDTRLRHTQDDRRWQV